MRVTPKELLELGLWERYCREQGVNVWSINEGLIDPKEELEWKVEAADDHE